MVDNLFLNLPVNGLRKIVKTTFRFQISKSKQPAGVL